MSRSHRDTTSSVSLFPFLAVLVCAMGALIFLLLVTTHRLRQQAIAKAEQERRQQTKIPLPAEPVLPSLQLLPQPGRQPQFTEQPSTPSIVDPNVALRATIARLVRQRDDLRGKLDRKRQAVVALRQQQHAAETAAVAARSKLVSIGHQQELEQIAQHSLLKQQTGLIGQIRQADRHLKTIQQQIATAESRYAILPFDAKTGTTRRPILIECTRDGLRFLPEDVTLSQGDLDAFTVGYNPLLAGARSLIQYWSGSAGSTGKLPSLPGVDSANHGHKPPAVDGPKPYVLLIVRPGGSIPFYRAKKYLARLGEPFGYELLEADHQLAVPAVDPGAQAAVRKAVDAVLAERTRLIATIGRGGAATGRRGRIDGRGTGSGRPTGSGRSNRYGSRFGEQPGTGRTTGRRSGGQNPNTEPRGTGKWNSTAGRQSDRYGSGFGERPRAGRMVDRGRGIRNPGTKRRGHGSQSGELFGDETSQTADTRQPTPVSGRFGQHTTGQQSAGQYAAEQHSAGGQSTGQYPAGQGSTGRQQTGAGQSRNGTGTRSGQRAAHSVGQPSGSHDARGGNTPNPFPRFGQSAATGSQSVRMMRQPRRWGHAGGRAGIGFERNIAVTIDATRIIVGNRLIVPVGQAETRKQLIGQVASAIDREARSWGPPPSGFYWVPNIQFQVHPGGNQFYERLNPAFRQWGLSTSVRFPVDSSDPPGNGG